MPRDKVTQYCHRVSARMSNLLGRFMVAAGFVDVGKDTDQPRGAVSSPGTDGDPVVCARQEADRPTCVGEWSAPSRVHVGISPAPSLARHARWDVFTGNDVTTRVA